MAEQNALMFDQRIAYDDDYQGLAMDPTEGERMAAKIGNRSIMFLASHGVVVTGPTVADAFNDLYYLERAAMFQVLARSTGGRLRRVSQQVRETCRRQFAEDRPKLAARHFTALRRMLDRGVIKEDQVKTIYTSQTFPTTGFGVAHNLMPELQDKIREAFFTFDWEGSKLLEEFSKSDDTSFIPITFKDDWAVIRKIDAANGVVYSCN